MNYRTENLSITYRDPKSLTPSASNSRTHSAKQVGQLAKSIKTFGFNNPILLDSRGEIVAGHGRVLAAIQLGLDTVPTVGLHHLSPEEKRAYLLADNKLAELAGWDQQLLAVEFSDLLSLDLDFDLTDTGFEMPEMEVLIERARHDDDSQSEDSSILSNAPAVTRPGDLWALGNHRVFCGDALDPMSYRVLLGSEKCQMVFTDPPYNVPVRGHVLGLGSQRHPDFLMASGEMSRGEFTSFLNTAMRNSADVSVDGAIHFMCIDWRHVGELLNASAGVYSEFKNLCVWVKSNCGMGSLYRSQHELVGVFKFGEAKHVNNVELGRHGRCRTNVWNYAGMNGFQKDRDAKLAMHPTVKPTELVRDAIYDCSSRNGIVLDQFGGSGTTLLAAEQAGRRARLIELEPRYVDVTLRRYFKATGDPPTNVWTGQSVETAANKSYSGSGQ
ncbi:DNA methyltransferase [Sphingomonas flavescens]|uniref:site-specific DNA-methyltransferase n=1 Tax=Sphingomonas flavescens TaxID=3132797 RepID=UPI0028037899|nr:DNA methyltransferase [Sphingomonas limnosediminicola]